MNIRKMNICQYNVSYIVGRVKYKLFWANNYKYWYPYNKEILYKFIMVDTNLWFFQHICEIFNIKL